MKKIIIASSIALLALSGQAFASKNGLYIGGQVGQTTANYNADDLGLKNATVTAYQKTIQQPLGTAKISTDNDGLGGRAYLGYQLNHYLALESGFTHFADIDVKNAWGQAGNKETVHQNAIDLVGKVMLPLGSSFNLFAKGGMAYVNLDSKYNKSASYDSYTSIDGGPWSYSGTSTTNASYSAKHKTINEVRPTYGFGASVDLTSSISADVSWTRIQGGSGIKDSDFIGVGLAWHI